MSIILPGESLAKYRDKPEGSGPSGISAENSAVENSAVTSIYPAGETSQQSGIQQAPAQELTEMVEQDPVARMAPPASSARRPFSSGLEPLPGEKLSKWKTHQHLPMEPKDVEANDQLPVPEAVRFAPLSPLLPLEQTETEDRTSHDTTGRARRVRRNRIRTRNIIRATVTITSHIPTGMSQRPLHADHIPRT